MSPSTFIKMIGSTYGYYPMHSYGCLKLALLLYGVYGGELYYNNGHVMIKINNAYYDKNGKHESIREGFLPAEDYGFNYFKGAFQGLQDVFVSYLKDYFAYEDKKIEEENAFDEYYKNLRKIEE